MSFNKSSFRCFITVLPFYFFSSSCIFRLTVLPMLKEQERNRLQEKERKRDIAECYLYQLTAVLFLTVFSASLLAFPQKD